MPVHVPVRDVKIPAEQDVASMGVVYAPEELLSEVSGADVPVEGAQKEAPYAAYGESPRGGPWLPHIDGWGPSFQVPFPRDKHPAGDTSFACDASRCGMQEEAVAGGVLAEGWDFVLDDLGFLQKQDVEVLRMFRKHVVHVAGAGNILAKYAERGRVTSRAFARIA
jgi:hypothetical protein